MVMLAIRFLDVFFLCRPVLLIPVWAFCMFGYLAGMSSLRGFSFVAAWSAPVHVAVWIFVFSLSVGAVYVFNQIVDRKVDALNEGFALLIRGNIPIRYAWTAAAALALSSAAIPLLNFPDIAFFSLAALVIGILYSARPAYFTGRPFIDFLTNATGYGIVSFGVGWRLAAGCLGTHFMVSALPYFFMMCAGSISSTIPDYEGDKNGGKMTTAVWLGRGRAHLLATCMLVFAAIISLVNKDYVAAACSLMSMPLYIVYLFSPLSRHAMEGTYKGGYLICMFMAFVIYPYFVPASLAVFAATVLYFRLRHHVFYPSLLPVSHE
jgi:4-hydroxybenzoate polyprenyltransferase